MTTSGQHRQDQVAGQVVIVTGGGGVIGRAIGEAFGRAGALVAVADLVRRAAGRDGRPHRGRPVGGRWASEVDVTDRTAVEQMVAQVERELGTGRPARQQRRPARRDRAAVGGRS